MKHRIFIFIMVLGLAACKNDKNELPIPDDESNRHNAAFDSLLKNYHEDQLKLNPLLATSLGDDRYNDTLPDFLSDRYEILVQNFYEDYQRRVKNYKDNTMSIDQVISKRIIEWECAIGLQQLDFKDDLMPLNQFYSLQLQIGQWASGSSDQPFKNAQDYKNWLKRLNGFASWLESAQKKMELGIKEGYVLPRPLIAKLSAQLEEMTNEDVKKHLFYKPVLNFPAEISASDRKEITKGFDSILGNKIIPAYKKVYKFVDTEYKEAGRTTSGIGELSGGADLYNFYIKKYTTTNMTADEIHELGLKEVERISNEMKAVMEEVGFAGSLKEFFEHVRNNKKLMPYNNPSQVIENFNTIHNKMLPKLEELFDLKPESKFEVRRTEAFREASASAEYNPGSLESDRPGIFYVPIPDVATYNTFTDESLFLHEAIPGHHYQISLQQENDSLPEFRKNLWYSGYGEGWALYCESLGKELGLYDDPYQYFGMLSAEMHRAIRLVVDTGIHSKGWSREQAIKYSLENEAESEASIIAEIERYMAIPGQALSYKIGQLKIRELRKKAEDALGSDFEVSQFHNQVLNSGCMPLNLLEEKIENWIKLNEKS